MTELSRCSLRLCIYDNILLYLYNWLQLVVQNRACHATCSRVGVPAPPLSVCLFFSRQKYGGTADPPGIQPVI